jgi:hypothetical protein
VLTFEEVLEVVEEVVVVVEVVVEEVVVVVLVVEEVVLVVVVPGRLPQPPTAVMAPLIIVAPASRA